MKAVWQSLLGKLGVAHGKPALPPSLRRQQAVTATRFLAVDLELTGLDVGQDHIVSMAWVPIRGLEIMVGEAEHHLINTSRGVGDSATIHGIHDHQSEAGQPLCAVLERLLPCQHEHVLIAHHARMDLAFLQVASQHCGHPPLHWPVVDTLALEARRLRRKGTVMAPDMLTLARCLQRHHLPLARQHDALADAFACAQLFLSQLAHHGNRHLRLGELLRLGR